MANVKRMLCWTGLLWSLLLLRAGGETIFVEAESMQSSSSGWVATSNDQTKRASRIRTLWGQLVLAMH